MKLVKGWGVNDTKLSGPACTVRDEFGRKSNYPDYAMWYAMVVRCHSIKEKARIPSVLESTCCESWKLRSNFQKWYNDQGYYFDNIGERLYLDKDILLVGNSEYCPDRCCLIPPYINTILNCGVSKVYGGLLWVRYRKDKPTLNKPYQCALTTAEGKTKHIAYYESEQEAHFRGQLEKANYIEYVLNNKYKQETSFNQNVYDALYKRVNYLRACSTEKEIINILL